MNEQRYREALSRVTAADIDGDEAVIAARAHLREMEARHREAAEAIEPLRADIARLPALLANARLQVESLDRLADSYAADQFQGGPERAWRDYVEEVAKARDLVRRLELAGPELERRLQAGSLRGAGAACVTAGIRLDEAIAAARNVRAIELMNA